jgi:adenosylmethionine---8-amino-7-oxononanoate aminotransferase
MTGFGRTGHLFACDTVQTKPDIVCLSKGITGGTMPFGATVATQDIFDAFYDDDRMKTLYHGHSYTANPVACAAALASLDILLDERCSNDRARIAEAHSAFAGRLKNNDGIKEVRQTGTIIAMELDTGAGTSYLNKNRDFIYKFFLGKNVLMRPLGNIIYLMPPYCITNEQLEYIYDCIEELLLTLKRQ